MGEAVSPRMRLFPQRVERLFQEIQEIPLAPVVSKNLFNVIEVKELWNVHCTVSPDLDKNPGKSKFGLKGDHHESLFGTPRSLIGPLKNAQNC